MTTKQSDRQLYQLAFPSTVSLSERGALVIECMDQIHEFRDLDAGSFYLLAQKLQYPFSIDDWKRLYPGQKSQMEQFETYCTNHRLILPVSANFLVSGREVAAFLRKLYEVFNLDLFSHILWTSLADGSASPALLKGWVIETYFFILGANARMPAAIAACQSDRIRKLLAAHYREEWDHYQFFAHSIESLGLSKAKVEERGPLLATHSVMWSARKMARMDELAYVACSGLLESTGTDAERGRRFYRALQRNYESLGPRFVEPMLKHVNLDEEYGHGSVMEEVFYGIECLTQERADKILYAVTEFKDTLLLWFDEICHHYGPRGPQAINALTADSVQE